MLRSDIAQELDLMVLDVIQSPHPPIYIVNLYNDKPFLGRDGAAFRLQNLQLPTDHLVILTGDWNLDNNCWSMPGQANDTYFPEIVDWLDDHRFTLLNEKGVPTHQEAQLRGGLSTLDLTWVNGRVVELDAVWDWKVEPQHSHGSDHYTITWRLDWGEEEVLNPSSAKFNFKDVDQLKWRDAFEEELGQREQALSSLLDAEHIMSPGELDEVTQVFTEALTSTTERTVPVKKPSNRAQPWWSKELSEANHQIANAREQSREHKQQWGTPNPVIQTLIKKS
ncbi:hypothetical protein JAAARDRAFT_200850 [Jaapia argillacea MUCL 33604]|uniref:Endonuclease/exonuclease/phosphatase domain-containing protein n=1 Tax=Jaapia argillacea MUCL 33604 TaxID=933084 RepID=A0A067P3I5_9AGAM|nr:hypothetical protein JAAARDRAFT_200850 [Jaapia argillacea MUCL 33604]